MFHPKSNLVNSGSSKCLQIATEKVRLRALREFYLIECKHSCTDRSDHQNKNAGILYNLYQFSVSMFTRYSVAYNSTVQGKSKGMVHSNIKHWKRTSREMAGI